MLPFLFIVGSARSGTTLLRLMFDTHPQLCVTRESHFIPDLARRHGTGPVDAEALCDELLANRWYRRWQLDDDLVRAGLTAPPRPDFAEALRRLYRCYADAQGKQRCGDKTPQYVRHLPLLAELLPEARFVHIIRDGRDVVASFLSTAIGPDRFDPGVRLWRDAVAAGRAAGAALGPERYTEVFYERLVAAPEQELRRLAAFAGLDYDPVMLRYHKAEGAADVGRYHAAVSQPPTPNLRDWRSELSPQQVRRFSALAGDLLAELGYPDPARDDGAGHERVAGAVERARRAWQHLRG